MIKLLLLLGIPVLSTGIFAQTFNGSTGNIQDVQTTNFTAIVSGLPTSINTTSFGFERVCVNLNHSFDADLTISIVAPDGSMAILASDLGGSDDNFTNTCFVWDAPDPIIDANAPFTGSFSPMEELGIVNNGQNPNGNWKLRITDSDGGDVGQVLSWSVTFGSNPADFFQFTESELPIVVLNTNGASIPDDPKIPAHMGIIYNGPGVMNHVSDPYNNYNNLIAIEQRGSSSGNFPQKSYGFETQDINGTKHDTVLLGMPEEHDWILYAPYDDKTCMRNILSYDIANKTGHYASRTKMCELVLNGQYKGIYVLMEKIKRDNGRVDIANLKPVDIAGDELTGGYILKVDRDDGPGSYWTSDFPASSGADVRIVHVEPKGVDIMPEQRAYIIAYVDSFETALDGNDFEDPLLGYRNFIDVPSFIDYLLLNEISKNVDGYRLSSFFYKNKNSNGGKLVAGPAWDYNLAWWNADYCQGFDETGWAYEFNDICGGGGNDVPFWWERLMEDPAFTSEVKCRWKELRQTVLSVPAMNTFIDSIAAYMDNAQERHFEAWPILGVYTWPNPSPLPEDFPGEIVALKTWITNRVAWMDNNLPGTCYLGIDEWTLQEEQLTVYPNPFNSSVQLNLYLPAEQELTITVTDMMGKTIKTVSSKFMQGENKIDLQFDEETMNSGIYLLSVASGTNTIVRKISKE